MEVKYFAQYLLPGAFLSEKITKEIPERTMKAAIEAAPAWAFAFILFDHAVVDFEYDKTLFDVVPKALDKSGTYYIDGEIYTVDQLRDLAIKEGDPSKYDIFISNVSQGRGQHRAIHCRTGNWQPFKDDDVQVNSSRFKAK